MKWRDVGREAQARGEAEVTMLLILLGIPLGVAALWAVSRSPRGEKSGPANNWRNEDHLSREADGTWAEGSTYSKSPSQDSSGLGL
jgi:hypothetical protein